MKALAAFTVLITLVSVAKWVEAASIYEGTLDADESYTINVDNTASGNNSTGLTIRYLIGGRPASEDGEAKLGKATKFDILTVPPASRQSYVQTLPRGTRRIAIEVAPPRNVTVLLEIAQALASFPEACVDGCTLIFDVE